MTTTTAGMTRSGRSERPRLLAALLAISVALNLFFVGGAVWSRLNAPAPLTVGERFHRLAQMLDLSPQQQVAFDQYVAAMLARTIRVRQATEPLMDEAWAEIAKPNPDQTKVLQLLDEFGAQRRQVQHEAVAATLSLLAALTPEQKAKFLADERERRMAIRRRHGEETR